MVDDKKNRALKRNLGDLGLNSSKGEKRQGKVRQQALDI